MRILHDFLPSLFSHVEAIASKGTLTLTSEDVTVLQGLVGVIQSIQSKNYTDAALTAVSTVADVTQPGTELNTVASVAAGVGSALTGVIPFASGSVPATPIKTT